MTLADQIKEVQREIAMRRKLYPGWIARGTLKQAAADRQLAAMEAVLATLTEHERRERITLFGQESPQ